MLLVPLLVGIAFLLIALMTQVELRADVERPPELTITLEAESRRSSPLVDAFPHLEFWVPTDDLFLQAADGADGGSAGPDIVIRRTRRRQHRSGQFSDAA